MSLHVPSIKPREGFAAQFEQALGAAFVASKDHVGELTVTVVRDSIVDACRLARDQFGYQQLMEIAGVDYPERPERFEVNYHLLSVTENHRLRLKLSTDEATPVPSVTGLWPVASWLEREVFDMYGVVFSGHNDLRRILTDYGFEGFPLRKDFPQTGYVEVRYSEAEKRVVYEPVRLPQDFRNWDFLMPWEGAEYRLPGDEKAAPQAIGAPSPAPATANPPVVKAVSASDKRDADKPYATDNDERSRRGAKEAQAEARKPASKKAENAGGRPVAEDDPVPAEKRRGRKTNGDEA